MSDTTAPSPYAAIADMISRFGEAELLRNTTPAGREADTIDQVRVIGALAEATDTIDSYLRRRYAVPLSPPPPQIVRVCCDIARADLANNGVGQATKPQLEARKAGIDWLKQIADGHVTLDGQVPLNTSTSFARTSDRQNPFSRGGCGFSGGSRW